MNSPKYVIKVPGDVRIGENMVYVENASGEVAIFENRDEAVQFLIGTEVGDEKMGCAEFIKSIGVCKRCGSTLFPSDISDYKSQCFDCDEDFYLIEQEVEKK